MKTRFALLVLIILSCVIGLLVLFPEPQQFPLQPEKTFQIVENEEAGEPPVLSMPDIAAKPTATPPGQEEKHIEVAEEAIPCSTAPGGIAGKVTTREGIPISGCEAIFLMSEGSILSDFIFRGRYRENEPYAITNASGEYNLQNLAPGSYHVVFLKPEYVYSAYAEEVVISAGKMTENIDQVLESAGSIFGRVIENLSGKSLEGIEVKADHTSGKYPLFYEWGENIGWVDRFITVTDSEGRFQFNCLPISEEYQLSVDHPGYLPVEKDSNWVGSGIPVRIVLSRGGSIEGKVASNIPGIDLSATKVNAWTEVRMRFTVNCDSSGNFHFENLAPDTYWLEAVNPAKVRSHLYKPIKMGLGQKITGIELSLEKPPRVSGKVLRKASRAGIQGATVHVGQEVVQTDAEGRFETEVFTRGECEVRVDPPSELYLAQTWLDVFLLDVQDEDIEGITLELSPGSVVRGRVVSQTGEGVAHAQVEILQMPSKESDGFSLFTFTSTAGTFEFKNLASAEDYLLQARSSEGIQQFYLLSTGQSQSSDDTPPPKFMGSAESEHFSLGPGEAKEDFILKMKPLASISGTVKDAQGNPLSEGYEILFGQLIQKSRQVITRARPNDQGFYFSSELPAGDISVTLFRFINENDIPLTRRLEQRIVTTCEGQEVSGVDFVAEKHEGFIAGRVVNDLGEEIPDWWIAVLQTEPSGSETELIEIASGQSDYNGEFRIEDIPPGVYNLNGILADVECPTEGLQFVVPRSAEISGRVISKTSGEPVHQFQVGVYGGNKYREGRSIQFFSFFDMEGRFKLENIPPQQALLKIRIDGGIVYEQTLNLKSGEILSDLVIEIE